MIYLNSLLILLPCNDAVHIDGRDMYAVLWDFPNVDDLLHFNYGGLGSLAHRQVEVACCLPNMGDSCQIQLCDAAF